MGELIAVGIAYRLSADNLRGPKRGLIQACIALRLALFTSHLPGIVRTQEMEQRPSLCSVPSCVRKPPFRRPWEKGKKIISKGQP